MELNDGVSGLVYLIIRFQFSEVDLDELKTSLIVAIDVVIDNLDFVLGEYFYWLRVQVKLWVR